MPFFFFLHNNVFFFCHKNGIGWPTAEKYHLKPTIRSVDLGKHMHVYLRRLRRIKSSLQAKRHWKSSIKSTAAEILGDHAHFCTWAFFSLLQKRWKFIKERIQNDDKKIEKTKSTYSATNHRSLLLLLWLCLSRPFLELTCSYTYLE